jgi:Fe2+ or Zn2+ uptake regulation protein
MSTSTKPTKKLINKSAGKSTKSKDANHLAHDTGSNDLSALLKAAGLKSTQGRIGVLETLFLTETPITVEAIIKELGKTSPDRATVYRIVDQFVKADLAKEVHFNDGVVRYEIVGAVEHDHCCHHVVCKNCGFAEHVESAQIESAIEKLISKVPNFKSVEGHSLEFFGTCNGCAGTKPKKLSNKKIKK